jgi:type IV pilus assembly protein PilA
MKKMNKKGFTLIEMLAVIAIIAVLVAIIVPAVGSSTIKAKASTDAANLRSVLSAATIEYATEGKLDALSVDTPAAKSVTATTIEVWMEGDELNAYYVNGTKYYTIDAFAQVAEGAKTEAGATITVVAEGTAPTGTGVSKVWPVAAEG